MEPFRLHELRVVYAATPADTSGIECIGAPSAAAAVLAPLFALEPFEIVAALFLDARNHLIGVSVVARGGLDSATVTPRQVFVPALLANAVAIITAHNHPSGDTLPSPDDLRLWQRMNDAGTLLAVSVYDHLILGHGGRYYSARESGAWKVVT